MNNKDEESGYGRDQVVQIINSVITKVQNKDFVGKEVLSAELYDLKKVIDEARSQIGAARPGEINGKHIPEATDELDAVIGATEEATGAIMDACEVIQNNIASADAEIAQNIEAEIIKIYEACSFQDITGQRITKVVRSLQTIEEKVVHILEVFEQKVPGIGAYDTASEEKTDVNDEQSLLNGPQMPDKAITQDDIDKLLAEFDN